MFVWLCCASQLPAQTWGLKSNLASDAGGHLNLGLETALRNLGPLWTFELGGDYRSWDGSDNERRRHLLCLTELRRWRCDRYLGDFVALQCLSGTFNYGGLDTDFSFLGTDFSVLRDHRFQGWCIGLGLGLGRDWAIDRHWNVEAQVALGWVHSWYDRFNCIGCGRLTDRQLEHDYWGPTKLSLSIVYLP